MLVSTTTGQPTLLLDQTPGATRSRVRFLDGTIRACSPLPASALNPDSPREALLEPVSNCPLCGSEPGPAVFTVLQLFWDVVVAACPRCGHLFKQEVPTPGLLARLYSESYVHFDVTPPSQDALSLLRPRVKTLGRPRGSGRHLDFGCGAGAFVAAAARAGWDSIGCDPYLPVLPKHHPLATRLHQVPLEELGHLGQFEVITLWASIEHVRTPGRTLRTLCARLQPGGRLVFNSPNGASLVARRRGSHWNMALLLEHLSFFTPRSVAFLAAELDLELTRLRRSGAPFPFGQSNPGADSQGLRPGVVATSPHVVEILEEPVTTARPGPKSLGAFLRAASRFGRDPRVMRLLRPALHLAAIGDHLEVVLTRRP